MVTAHYIGPLFFTGILSISLAFYVLHLRRELVTPFILLMSSTALWSFAYGFELLSRNLIETLFWAKVKYVGVVTVPSFWLYVAVQYIGRIKHFPRYYYWFFVLEPAITLLLVWTNDYHGLIWNTVQLDPNAYLSLKVITRGYWFWIHTFYSYLLMALGSLILLRRIFSFHGFSRKQAFFVFIGSLAPWVGNALYVSGFSPLKPLDATPFSFAITGVALFLGLFQTRLIEILPVARKAIVESMEDYVILLDADECIAEVNPAARKIFDLKLSDLLGQPIRRFIPWWPDKTEMIQSQKRFYQEIEFRKGDTVKTYDFRATPIYGRYHRLISRLVIIRDITAKKESEKALNGAYQKLQNTQAQLIQTAKLASIGQLAAGIAHELNQPLMVIRSLAQLMKRDPRRNGSFGDSIREHTGMIEKNTKRMMNIINHLRVFSRESKTAFSPLDINKIMEDCFLLMGEQLRLRSITVEKSLQSDLPEVRGNTTQLEQVLLNLLSNARDAVGKKISQEKGTPIESEKRAVIKITTRRDPADPLAFVEILVEDSGCGIETHNLQKIFDPFFTTKEVDEGTGLGLSISYGIIKDHQGVIEIVKSSPAGTVFRIRLPVDTP